MLTILINSSPWHIATQTNKLKVHFDSLYKYKDDQWAIKTAVKFVK